jgi:hypothetical protein
VPEQAGTLDDVAKQVRSKNAGPFWVTLDVFLATDDDYRHVLSSGVISKDAVGDLYHVDPAGVRIFELPNIRVIKVSFPRNVVAGDFEDRDLHAGQQYVVLAGLATPLAPAPSDGGAVDRR